MLNSNNMYIHYGDVIWYAMEITIVEFGNRFKSHNHYLNSQAYKLF